MGLLSSKCRQDGSHRHVRYTTSLNACAHRASADWAERVAILSKALWEKNKQKTPGVSCFCLLELALPGNGEEGDELAAVKICKPPFGTEGFPGLFLTVGCSEGRAHCPSNLHLLKTLQTGAGGSGKSQHMCKAGASELRWEKCCMHACDS